MLLKHSVFFFNFIFSSFCIIQKKNPDFWEKLVLIVYPDIRYARKI